MIIDSHTQVREGRGEIKDCLNAMDENHIDMAIVHPIVPGSDSLGYSDNAFVHKLVKAHPDRLMGYACVVPTELKADYELRKRNLALLTVHGPMRPKGAQAWGQIRTSGLSSVRPVEILRALWGEGECDVKSMVMPLNVLKILLSVIL